jgi:hypothetical protein
MEKKRPQRWLRLSLLVELVKKMRDFFVLYPVMEKNLSQFLKIRFHFPRISSGKGRVEQTKNGENEKRGFVFGKAVFQTPPEVVCGFRGGGGVYWNRVLTPVWGVVLENYHSGPPPLVKSRMVRGGSEIFYAR